MRIEFNPVSRSIPLEHSACPLRNSQQHADTIQTPETPSFFCRIWQGFIDFLKMIFCCSSKPKDNGVSRMDVVAEMLFNGIKGEIESCLLKTSDPVISKFHFKLENAGNEVLTFELDDLDGCPNRLKDCLKSTPISYLLLTCEFVLQDKSLYTLALCRKGYEKSDGINAGGSGFKLTHHLNVNLHPSDPRFFSEIKKAERERENSLLSQIEI